jgi:hypothetical protein
MELTEDDIKEINEKVPNDWDENVQGVFKQPFGAPNNRDEYFVYMRYLTGGMTGGSYHADSYLRPFSSDYSDSPPQFVVLDEVLKKLKPDTSYLQYKDIEKMIISSNDDDGADYYGNRQDFEMRMIPLNDLIEYLKNI